MKMSTQKMDTLMLRWSLVTGAAIAIFWAIHSLVIGEVPTISSVEIWGDSVYPLPFAISRWWDILIGPIWSVAILQLINIRTREYGDIAAIIVTVVGISLGLGLIMGLFVGMPGGLASSLAACLLLALIFMTIITCIVLVVMMFLTAYLLANDRLCLFKQWMLAKECN